MQNHMAGALKVHLLATFANEKTWQLEKFLNVLLLPCMSAFYLLVSQFLNYLFVFLLKVSSLTPFEDTLTYLNIDFLAAVAAICSFSIAKKPFEARFAAISAATLATATDNHWRTPNVLNKKMYGKCHAQMLVLNNTFEKY